MLILAYHSVLKYPTPKKYVVSPERFERQLTWLATNRQIIDIRSFDPIRLDRHQVLITFDDGYRDNFQIVFPLIKKYNIPIAIFLATEFVGKQMILGGESREMLQEKEIREMHKSGLVYFGCHTHKHLLLDQEIDVQTVEDDISLSCSEIERLVGYRPAFFVYPKGRYFPQVRKVIEEHFCYAFRGRGAFNCLHDPLQIPRIEISGTENRLKEWLKMHPSKIWI